MHKDSQVPLKSIEDEGDDKAHSRRIRERAVRDRPVEEHGPPLPECTAPSTPLKAAGSLGREVVGEGDDERDVPVQKGPGRIRHTREEEAREELIDETRKEVAHTYSVVPERE